MSLEWLRFDLDEAALQSDFVRVSAKIAALLKLGVLVNIDHFGQGLVQLNRLADVKINKYKLAGQVIEAGMEYLQGYRISRELTPDAAEWLSRRGGSELGA
jgi:EAL domain-containing protein (putative c-di-GMP-specific phosphodiesterase class I)